MDPLAGAAKILEILVLILPRCVAACKNVKFCPNDGKILLDMEEVERELAELDDEDKVAFADRLDRIEAILKQVRVSMDAIAQRRSFWEKWSRDHRKLIESTKDNTGYLKHMARTTSREAKIMKAMKMSRTKVTIDAFNAAAKEHGVEPRQLLECALAHLAAQRDSALCSSGPGTGTSDVQNKGQKKPKKRRGPKPDAKSTKDATKAVRGLAVTLVDAMAAPGLQDVADVPEVPQLPEV